MGQLILAALSLVTATAFSWSMQRLRDDIRLFHVTRRQMLADPSRAVMKHCDGSDRTNACKLNISLRSDGAWDDVCNHLRPETFRTERYYQVTLSCKTPLPERALPPMVTLLKR